MAITFKTTPDNRYFEDYIPGDVYEFGAIPVGEEEVIQFGKRYVPLAITSTKKPRKKAYTED